MRRRIAISLLTLAFVLGVAADAPAARHMEVAVQDDAVLANHLYGNYPRTLKLVSQLHASWIRVNVKWTYVVGKAARRRKAPKRIKYNWTAYDGLIRLATPRGIRLELTLTGPAPAWATGNHRWGHYKPKASAFKAFAAAAAEHFRGKVDRYSIWNEPNYVGWLSPLSQGPRLYRALYIAGYRAIKRADPHAQVLIGETSPVGHRGRSMAPLEFLRRVTCATRSYTAARICAPLFADGYAQHAYDPTHSPTYRYPGADNVTLATLYRLTNGLDDLAAEGLLSTPLGEPLDVYITEYGYFASGKNHVSASRHARYLVEAFKMAQRNPRVRQLLQYLLVKPRGNLRHFDTSIADSRSRPTLAFKKLASWAKAAVAAGKIAAGVPPASCAPLHVCLP
jgi:Cellulase (glycosyl hydrolase family 5)